MIQVPVGRHHREAQLIGLLQGRQERGFRLLYEHYGANLYEVALRIVRCPAIAGDVVQESFVKVWRNIEAYNPAKGRLFTWLLNIVRNTALDHWRSQGRLSHWEWANQAGLSKTSNPYDAQLPAYLLSMDHIGVDRLLKCLSPEQQLVVDYLYLRGYTHAEAAQTLGLPLGTVKTRVRLALIHLRRLAGLV
jgi:RNA polymerase sigma-70 factor (ECF subfamily)